MADEHIQAPRTPSVLAAEELAREGEAAAGTPPVGGIPGRERADRIRTIVTYTVMFTVAVN